MPRIVVFVVVGVAWLLGVFCAGWTAGGTLPVALVFVGLLAVVGAFAVAVAEPRRAPNPTGRIRLTSHL